MLHSRPWEIEVHPGHCYLRAEHGHEPGGVRPMIAKHAGRNRKSTPSSSAHQITEMISTRKPSEVDIVCFIHRLNSADWQIFNHFFKNFRKGRKISFSRSPA